MLGAGASAMFVVQELHSRKRLPSGLHCARVSRQASELHNAKLKISIMRLLSNRNCSPRSWIEGKSKIFRESLSFNFHRNFHRNVHRSIFHLHPSRKQVTCVLCSTCTAIVNALIRTRIKRANDMSEQTI